MISYACHDITYVMTSFLESLKVEVLAITIFNGLEMFQTIN